MLEGHNSSIGFGWCFFHAQTGSQLDDQCRFVRISYISSKRYIKNPLKGIPCLSGIRYNECKRTRFRSVSAARRGKLLPDGYMPRLMDRALSDRLEQVGAVEITGTMFCLKTWTAVICARRCPYKRIPVQDGTPGWKKNG